VTLTRLQTYAKANEDVSTLLDAHFAAVDQQIAKIAVWGVHYQRLDQAVILIADRGVQLTCDDLYELAGVYRKIWQLDKLRTERSQCYLCRDTLPAHEEQLCRCFLAVQVGRHTDTSPEGIAKLKKSFPHGWDERCVETYQCKNPSCRAPQDVSAGVVDSKHKQGQEWVTPKLCQVCYRQRGVPRQRTSSAPPPPSARVRVPVVPKSNPPAVFRKAVEITPPPDPTTDTLSDLQRQAIQPTAEG
jgi:hypothetical protein